MTKKVALVVGQIELYTHVPIMRRVVNQLQNWNFRVCGVFLIDSQFCVEQSKFLSGMLTALSSMIQLEIPFIHVLSKVDLLSKRDKKRLKKYEFLIENQRSFRFLPIDSSILMFINYLTVKLPMHVLVVIVN